MSYSGHVPVMLSQVLAYLRPQDGKTYIDATFGGGGYTKAILQAADCNLIALDRDPDAITRGRQLENDFGKRLALYQGPFSEMAQAVAENGLSLVDGVVFDLGVSSFQLAEAERGFSFMRDGPLDMRMSQQGETAADLLSRLSEAELADVIYIYGEEKFSRRIAKAIVQAREEEPFERTLQLASLIEQVVPKGKPGKKKIHPATKTFQALRIAVNAELDEVHQGLEEAIRLLAVGGRVVVVSFHSLEDRIAKQVFKKIAGPRVHKNRYRQTDDNDGEPSYVEVERRVVKPEKAEADENPRARSAKMRILEREQ